MRKATIEITGASPYSASKAVDEDSAAQLKGESKDAADARYWRERMHVTKDGNVFIPGISFKLALEAAAKYRGEKIKGKGNQTWGKKFAAGIIPLSQEVDLGIKADAVSCERLFVPSDGQRGGGKRVYRRFPVIPTWKCSVDLVITDDEITEEIFSKAARDAGLLIGIGRWRPERGGMKGRFNVTKISWSEMA